MADRWAAERPRRVKNGNRPVEKAIQPIAAGKSKDRA